MHARRRSTSLPPNDAPYQPIPQEVYSPDFANVIPSTVLETELDVEEAEGAVLSDPILPHPVDNQIRWIHFVLGCAVLLPWNGMALAC